MNAKFKILDFDAYGECTKLVLDSIYRIHKNEWKCTTNDGRYLNVICKASIIAVGLDEREYDADSVVYVGSYNLSRSQVDSTGDLDKGDYWIDMKGSSTRPPWEELAKFMKWKYREENLWDDC